MSKAYVMVKLYNEDCFIAMKNLIKEKVKFDAIIVDPPYNIGYDSWDNEFNMSESIRLCKDLIKENGNIIIFQGWSNVCKTKEILDNYFIMQNWIIWDRIKGRGTKKQLVSTREDILWYCNGENPTFNKIYSNIPKKTKGMGEKNGQSNRALTNVWYDISPIVPWSKERNGHPTQKPLQLMERIVKIFTNEEDVVLDFCCGSGTTGKACVNLNRSFVGVEKDKHWYNVTKERIKNE